MLYSPVLKPEFLKILCHPETHEPFLSTENQFLVSQSGKTFPVRKGIPQLIPSRQPTRHRFWEWVYNRTAFAYDWGVAFAWRYRFGGQPIDRQTYLQKINIQPDDFVLETAVGTGTNIQQLPMDARYIGLDISFNMLLRCQKNLSHTDRDVMLVQGDAQFLPFLDNTFDAVYHMGGLQFLTQPKKALSEALRVCKPDGCVWMIDETYSIHGLLKRSGVRKKLHHKANVQILSEIVPSQAVNTHVESISNGELYFLSFRKKDEKIV